MRFHRKKQPLHCIVRDYARRFWLVWKENADLRRKAFKERYRLAGHEQRLAELEREVNTLWSQLTEKENEIQSVRAQLAKIEQSGAWRLFLRLAKRKG
jgi:septal ring factor EnvC (AmiA/AmiB activator)